MKGIVRLKESNDTTCKKTFDWILQSDNPGNFVIDAQDFVYFDPIDKKYKKLCTNPGQSLINSKGHST